MLWFSSQAWDRSLVKCHICHLMVHCLQCVVKIILFLSASIINACCLKFSPQGMDSKECTVSVMWADIELPTSWDFWSNPGQILTTQSSFKWKAYSYAQDCQWVLVVVEINLAWAWAWAWIIFVAGMTHTTNQDVYACTLLSWYPGEERHLYDKSSSNC